MEKLIIVKVGGKVVENPQSLQALLEDFSKIAGYKLLVHGGGSMATDMAARLGIETQMLNGRRITDEEMLKVVTMVYAGLVNKNIVAKLQAMDINALGLCGADLNFMRSQKRPVKDVDYGFVGDVKEVQAEALAELILQSGVVPVLAPITHDKAGNLLNTNADTIAAEAAKAMTDYFDVHLIYCFEKKGVLRSPEDEDSVIECINKEEFKQYIEEGIIQSGMIPKLENAFDSLRCGVKKVLITKASQLLTSGGTIIH